MPKAANVTWTRDHLLVALNLYCKLPFGRFHDRNPIIVDVASKLGRTAGSLAMKLSNFASLDPVQRARGIKGLSGASRQDKEMWQEFHARIEELGAESEQILHDLFTHDRDCEVDFLERDKVRLEPHKKTSPSGPTESLRSVRVRRGQQFFRQTVLNSYGVRCCISTINVPRLLIASHIKPWRDFPRHRLDPTNGLCLSTLHDAAFDCGLITIDAKFRVVLSKKLKLFLPSQILEDSFVRFEGQEIQLPNKVAEPNPAFLRYHRQEIFQK